MNELILEAKGQYDTVKIFRDDCPPDPREWDNLGVLVCFHKRYCLGDRHNFKTPEELREFLKTNKVLSLPVYMYDHSGLALSTTPFNDKWDSGQLGLIYATHEAIKECYGSKRLTKKVLEQATNLLKTEIQEYEHYLQGEAYRYEIIDTLGDIQDTGSGFLGPIESNGLIDNIGEEFRASIKAALIKTRGITA